jgi:hypothetical protein
VLSVPVLTFTPSKGSAPFHDPDAVQSVAFAVDQVNAAALPAAICVGVASMVTVGGTAKAPTISVMVLAALPPAPLQVNV